MKKITNDFMIGLVVIVALGLVAGLTLKVSKFSFSRSGYEIKVLFVNSSGIEKDAPVRLSGVEMGKVKDIQIFYDSTGTHVLLTLWLDRRARLRQDSEAFVTSLGLMGEKYLELTAGSPEATFLSANTTIVGREPFDTTRLMERGSQIADNLDQAITNIRELSSGVNEIITVHREDLDKLLSNLMVASENLKAFSEDIKRHPWKLLQREKTSRPKRRDKKRVSSPITP